MPVKVPVYPFAHQFIGNSIVDSKYGGTACDELRDGVQLIRCRAETPCSTRPNIISTEQPFFEYEGKI